MVVNASATFARTRFGEALKAARLDAGVKQRAVAKALDRSTVDRVSRLERGTAWPDDDEWRIILQVLDLDPLESVRLDTMRREGQLIGNDWWTRYEEFPPSLHDFLGYEDAASTILTSSANTLPALLQTADYARALTRGQTGSSTDYLERSVEIRVKRRRIFEKAQPPTVEAVFSVGALHQVMGDTSVMVEQLDRLIRDAERGISLRIVPYSASATPVYMFHIFEYDGPDEKPIAAVDSMTGMTLRKSPQHAKAVREFRQTFDLLRDASLSPEESLEVIRKQRKEYSHE